MIGSKGGATRMNNQFPQYPDPDGEMSATLDRYLLQPDKLREVANFDPAAHKKIVAQAEVIEKKFSVFLADSEEILRQRETAKAMIMKFAQLRKLLNGERESGN
jgi:hypothetical protein